MNIDYVKLSPTENTTILVRTAVPRERQAELAARLLEAVGGEQVGYIEGPSHKGAKARLQMMGGEFCGNATMALGAIIARDDRLSVGESADLVIEVSGTDAPVPCRMVREETGWKGTVQMPLPTSIREITLETDGGSLTVPAVELPGISHLILPAGAGLDDAQLRRRLPVWNQSVGADALGALVWDEDAASIDPLVCVPSAGTLVRERGCGSGSAAVGCWLALREGRSLETAVRQPGGVIKVDVQMEDGALTGVTITGHVEIVEEGSVEMGFIAER